MNRNAFWSYSSNNNDKNNNNTKAEFEINELDSLSSIDDDDKMQLNNEESNSEESLHTKSNQSKTDIVIQHQSLKDPPLYLMK